MEEDWVSDEDRDGAFQMLAGKKRIPSSSTEADRGACDVALDLRPLLGQLPERFRYVLEIASAGPTKPKTSHSRRAAENKPA